MTKFSCVISSILFFPAFLFGQSSFSGKIFDKNYQTPIAGVTVILMPSQAKTISDENGYYTFSQVQPGTYNVIFQRVGYLTYTNFNLVITSGNNATYNAELIQAVNTLEAISVQGKTRKTARAASLETPLSVQRLTTEEIKSNPGGNFDISRVINTLPGVGGTAGSVGGFRNDIIIRGGGPGENVFYVDGIEVPIINHFATQGAGGGPTGILNVSFIEEVKLSTSAFNAQFDNALSSVFEFKQKKGNNDRLQGNIRLSATELATTFDGPIVKNKSTFLASIRRSYLQLLFSALDLPIRPNYWDFQFKSDHQISSKTSLTTIGIGAIDEFSFAAPKQATPEKLYALNSNPSIQQNSYTLGLNFKTLIRNGYYNIAISRNYFNNTITRFENNLQPNAQNQILDIQSAETENKIRLTFHQSQQKLKWSYGGVLQQVKFTNSGFVRVQAAVTDTNNVIIQPALFSRLNTKNAFWRYGLFAQVGSRLLNNKLGLNAGLRIDGNSFAMQSSNPFNQFSPRLSLNYVVSKTINLNASWGKYFKQIPYSIISFQNNTGNYVNNTNGFYSNTHYVMGLEYLPRSTTRFTVEGFYKKYSKMPVSIRDGINLANKGGDFNVLGNESVNYNGKGKTYGIEFFAQQKLTKRFFGLLSYTWFRSLYNSGLNQPYIASAWDTKHLLSFAWGYKFDKNWEIGLKFRYQGGAPFTPFDEVNSRINYLSLGEGILDYDLLNAQRLNNFHSSDVRIDKKWNFKKLTIDLFLDVTNWYVAKTPAYPQYIFKRNESNTDFVTTNNKPIAKDGSNAIPVILSNNDANVVPTLGFIIEF